MPSAPTQTAAVATSGQIIEYIENRLFLASYTHPPDVNTPFPYVPKSKRSPNKRSSRHLASPSPAGHAPHTEAVYLSIDKVLLYNAFHADFGPLHIGHLYRFAVYLHEVLGAPENEGKVTVLWSHADSRSRANAACILACYMVLIQEWPPHLALAPISQMDPPLMPFRDAGYSQADYSLTVQDVVYGVWRAKQEGICGLKDFNLEEYERYERVDMGDFNWVTPNFVAFASPQHSPAEKMDTKSHEYASLPRSTAAVMNSSLPNPFKQVLAHFRKRRVGLVVRLNSELYSPSHFAALGITHMDMIFEDGTCPHLKVVRKFIGLAHKMINVEHRGIAVHCKAGLGRTGCLIGAYLIYRHGFTANEVIAYMRFMRPGMVVGPQQHWLHLNQGTFREWWFEDSMKDKIAMLQQSTPPRVGHRASRVASNGQTFTPPVNGSQKRRALGELDDYNERHSASIMQDENLPAPTPGQPRKTSKLYGERHNPYTDNENDEPAVQPDTEIISVERHLHPDGDQSEEEYKLQMLAGTRSISRSPSNSHKKRAVSCMTTTTTTTSKEWSYPDGPEVSPVPTNRTPSTQYSGNGSGLISVGKRGSPVRRATERSGGIRKTSGRVGSGPQAARVKG